ncbi:MAG: outer membrane protein transport protein, partial [Ignavibacteria bacterium]
MKKALQTAVLALIIFSNAFASGFQLNEHGAKAMSMANAFTAYANDPSALYFNPAAIAFHKGTKIMLGVSPIAPSYSFEGPSPSTTSTDAENKVFLPFNFYATHKINEQWAVGFAVNVPFGLGTEWDQAWAGKYLAIETELQTFFFQPVVAFKPSENISISVGVNFSLADVTIKRKNYEVAALNPDVLASVEGDDTGFGFTAAIMFKPSDKISLGAAYRSEVSYDFEGDATSEPSSVTHPLLGT